MLGKKGDTNTNIKFQLCIFSNFWDINKKISDYTLNSIYINAINIIVFGIKVYLIFYLIFYLIKFVINEILHVKLSVSSKSRKYWRFRETFNSNPILITGSILFETCLK